jgi:integrase
MGNYGELLGMASIHPRKRSPYWFLKYKDSDTGVWKEKNLKLRRDDPKETKMARREAERVSQTENEIRPIKSEDFDAWVPTYLDSHFTNDNSKSRYHFAWARIQEWFKLKKIHHPKQFFYDHIDEYMAWRKGGKSSKHNTARLEMKFLSSLLTVAVKKKIISENPFEDVPIKKNAPKQKKQLTDEEIGRVRTALATKEPWMRTMFEILLYTGCRFSEARFSKEEVDFKKMVLKKVDKKRAEDDPKKEYEVPLDENLGKFLKTIAWEDGMTLPEITKEMNNELNAVMKKACGATSHSCRVTFISRCHRDGVPQSVVLDLVNHSSALINRIYTRTDLDGAREQLKKVKLPAASLPLS